MIKKLMAIFDIKEALAVIGIGLLVFGIWQIYHPAAYLFAGGVLTIPFINAVRSA